ncbi:hypothetical protein GE061_018983 [Apolygus lucorum]|uniref:Uncharacterized protein n=1 Tax=Apolygus lucorum TaxID=248454 RepID=A0A8S9X939_APOLU|nr:hypothetical protein GE061_018983 [Apolygus lucorum]
MPLDNGSATSAGHEKGQELIPVETKSKDLEMVMTLHDQLQIYHPPQRLSPKEIEVVDLQVEQFKDGIIKQYSSHCFSQVMVVRKKDDNHRVWCNCKRSNSKTVEDRFSRFQTPCVLSNPPSVFERVIKRNQPTSKLRPRFHGPYHITAVEPKDTCNVEFDARTGGPATATTCPEFVKPWPEHSGQMLIQGGRMKRVKILMGNENVVQHIKAERIRWLSQVDRMPQEIRSMMLKARIKTRTIKKYLLVQVHQVLHTVNLRRSSTEKRVKEVEYHLSLYDIE